jgi:hypothetical protein
MVKVALQVTDDAANGAVADRLALERGRHGSYERVAIGRVQGAGGMCDGENLRLA